MQYSSATTMIPPGIEQVEPELESEDEQTVKDEDKPVTKEPITEQPDETESEETESEETKSEAITGGFGSNLVDRNFSNLAEANATYAPRYTITIKFDSFTVVGGVAGVGGVDSDCSVWKIAVYVQGEKNVLEFPMTQTILGQYPIYICSDSIFKPIPLEMNPPVTVEIPGEPVESVYDSMPLSIFTVGEISKPCQSGSSWRSWPSELPEVKSALADKGSTRPYYAHTMEKITQIQKEIKTTCELSTLNVLEGSPNYGKRVPADTVGNPESVKVTTCTHPNMYCLTYTITCPLCLAQRDH